MDCHVTNVKFTNFFFSTFNGIVFFFFRIRGLVVGFFFAKARWWIPCSFFCFRIVIIWYTYILKKEKRKENKKKIVLIKIVFLTKKEKNINTLTIFVESFYPIIFIVIICFSFLRFFFFFFPFCFTRSFIVQVGSAFFIN